MRKFVFMESNEIPMYQGAPTGVLSTRVPVQIKMQFTERCMKYRLSVGDYLGYIVSKVSTDDRLLDPEYLKTLESQLSECKEALEAAINLNQQLLSQNEGLQSRLKDVTKDLEAQVDDAIQEGDEKLSKALKAGHTWKSKAQELQARLDKANARLKEENITDGSFLSKQTLVQF